MITSTFSLRKSRHIMHSSYAWYKKRAKTLPQETKELFEKDLQQLDQALLNKDRATADSFARKLDSFCNSHFKKSIFDFAKELLIALVLALAIATVVRQTWFELYEIPTGSMRPTFKEQDHLTVSKLAFGINIPLETEHFYFDPNLVQRSSVLIFSGDGIPHIDMDTTYFWLFPYKKRYIKRLIAKPNDSVYFYGGKLYVVDKDGNLVPELLESPWMQKLEHIPFLNFEGMISTPNPNQIIFKQMNLPVGKLSVTGSGEIVGEVFNGKEWVTDKPTEQKKPHTKIQTYSDIMGMRNFAMARLLTKEQLQQDPTIDSKDLEDGVLYLELRHNPSLTYPKPAFLREGRGYGVMLTPLTTVIPLTQSHLDAIMDNMYTARFVVNNGEAQRYSVENQTYPSHGPRFPGVSDGTYEFYNGKAVKVGWGGITSALPEDHPLYKHTPENIQKLYNLGIEMDLAYAPHGENQIRFPQRYAYFRDGNLYLLGAPILKKDDPALKSFIDRESKREQQSTANKPYIAFKDYGPPLNQDGSANVDFIRTFGVTIPESTYLVLGDNHAMSSDSRVFGFVPQKNLQGAPSLIIWPPGDRLGPPKQKPYPIINVPRLIVWSIALFIFLVWYAIHRRNLKRPIFKKLS